MAFQATVIEDSISPDSVRLTAMHVRYPRMIHSEIMTHRVFTRNARSSRAVPVLTLAKEDIYIPQFSKNQPGMQAGEELSIADQLAAREIWENMARQTISGVKLLADLGVHKQWANRPLEWFGWIDVLISSTWWENFYELRLDDGAQPEARHIAKLMYDAMDNSRPKPLQSGEWHLPYVTDKERLLLDLETQKKVSTARCARLSYRPFDGKADVEAEIERYNKLVVSRPVHASPAEHQATPDYKDEHTGWAYEKCHGNFYGWVQHRKLLPNEAVMEDRY